MNDAVGYSGQSLITIWSVVACSLLHNVRKSLHMNFYCIAFLSFSTQSTFSPGDENRSSGEICSHRTNFRFYFSQTKSKLMFSGQEISLSRVTKHVVGGWFINYPCNLPKANGALMYFEVVPTFLILHDSTKQTPSIMCCKKYWNYHEMQTPSEAKWVKERLCLYPAKLNFPASGL